MTDILIMLDKDHPAIFPIYSLISLLPKMQANSSVPYHPSIISTLHRQNVNSIINHMINYNISIPVTSSKIIDDPTDLQPFTQFLYPTLCWNHPLLRIKRLLNHFHLLLMPADKTKVLVVIPKSTIEKERRIHLSDDATYKLLTEEQYKNIISTQNETILETSLFYGISKTNFIESRQRYMYFLPKIHKPQIEWRSLNHPKMRPIICDSGSNTCHIAKFLLRKIQPVESQLSTVITSSTAIAYHLSNLDVNITSNIQLTTIDVESLFTKIPLDRLMSIISAKMDFLSPEEHQIFIKCLDAIIKLNTFTVGDEYYLQNVGVPMGGCLSGSLANIYLSDLENHLSKDHHILLYKRYMDDILIISYFTNEELNEFVNNLPR
jgi:hypothetical protein